MNFDQLKAAWQAGIAAPAGAATVNRLTDDVQRAERRYRHQALARRIYGSTAMTLAVALLATVSWLPGGVWPGMRVAIAVWSLSLLACIVMLWRMRSRRHPGNPDTLIDHLADSLHAIDREIAYFRALRWLFWLPFGIGFAFAVSWQAPHGGAPLPLLLGTAGLWAWGMLYGPRTMLKHLQPQADALARMLEDARGDIEADGEYR